ncbi:MFS transporter [Methylobacterium aerolatum]|uniref:AAHS family 4-hydroxybenzoate transporter-like MFS transporter n=1 Tax=Methylobacterium aerolatum TaxID=418708 RepID=A0ABU0I5M6_9HYPH|nr:MFS transporter [Methylobacterium aerolatum]MDQ0449910.1 AAHS family 4-hydroxybenzoate transporter-like MFS transporter [Methylobacterium aerolatum]GJD37345.1 4-hydroxybenzoate transporter PcaK [Methylobacterium aerolatum]
MGNEASAAGRIDVTALIDGQRLHGGHGLIVGLCFLVVLLDGFDTAAIGYIAPMLVTEWGVSRAALAPVVSAALVGLALGALAAGPLSDRFGRKTVLVLAMTEVGLACLASAFSADPTQLMILRFITGLGLGAAMPNAVTLTSESMPARRRALLTNVMFCGFPLGAACGGFLAAWMIPAFGWRSVLILGGVAPLALVLVLVPLLPESVRNLVARGAPARRIHAALRVVTGGGEGSGGEGQGRDGPAAAYTLGTGATPGRSAGLRLILSPAYRLGSAMLWLAYFCGLIIFYALINWMPILFRESGLDPRTAALITALFPLGGIGAIPLGMVMDRLNADAAVAGGFAVTAAAVALIGQATGRIDLLVPAVLIAGLAMNTAQSSLPALAAAYYPTEGRGTGVAWMMGLGRFGGIAGSFLVAGLATLSLPATFAVIAGPALIAALAVGLKRVARPGKPRPDPAPATLSP